MNFFLFLFFFFVVVQLVEGSKKKCDDKALFESNCCGQLKSISVGTKVCADITVYSVKPYVSGVDILVGSSEVLHTKEQGNSLYCADQLGGQLCVALNRTQTSSPYLITGSATLIATLGDRKSQEDLGKFTIHFPLPRSCAESSTEKDCDAGPFCHWCPHHTPKCVGIGENC